MPTLIERIKKALAQNDIVIETIKFESDDKIIVTIDPISNGNDWRKDSSDMKQNVANVDKLLPMVLPNDMHKWWRNGKPHTDTPLPIIVKDSDESE